MDLESFYLKIQEWNFHVKFWKFHDVPTKRFVSGMNLPAEFSKSPGNFVFLRKILSLFSTSDIFYLHFTLK